MLSYEDAKKLAKEHYKTAYVNVNGGVVLLEERTISTSYGWVFFCNTREFLDTGNVFNAILSSAPVLVEAATGKLHQFGTRHPVEHYLREFERVHGYSDSVS
jgi:hypothetical protein